MVAAAAAVELGVVGGVGVGVRVRVGVGIAAAAASSNRIGLSYWHLWRDWVRVWIGYGTGMDRGMARDTLSGPFTVYTLWLFDIAMENGP